jgi:hypothetical protein
MASRRVRFGKRAQPLALNHLVLNACQSYGPMPTGGLAVFRIRLLPMSGPAKARRAASQLRVGGRAPRSFCRRDSARFRKESHRVLRRSGRACDVPCDAARSRHACQSGTAGGRTRTCRATAELETPSQLPGPPAGVRPLGHRQGTLRLSPLPATLTGTSGQGGVTRMERTGRSKQLSARE